MGHRLSGHTHKVKDLLALRVKSVKSVWYTNTGMSHLLCVASQSDVVFLSDLRISRNYANSLYFRSFNFQMLNFLIRSVDLDESIGIFHLFLNLV